MSDSQPTSVESVSKGSNWAAPVALAVAIGFYNLVLSPLHGAISPSKWLAASGIGVLFVQPLLVAAWAALGTGSLIYRLPVSAATLIAWMFAHSISDWNLFAGDGARNDLNIEMTFAFVIVFVVATAIIGLVRRVSGVHISRYQQSAPPSPRRRHQFGMKYVLGWMTVCALLIVVGRAFVSDPLRNHLSWLSLLWDLLEGSVLLLLLTMPPAVLPLLALTRPTPWRWLLMFIVSWPVSLGLAIAILTLSVRSGPPNAFEFCAGVQLGVTAIAVFSAVVLRLAGFHLTSRVDSTSNLPVAEPTG